MKITDIEVIGLRVPPMDDECEWGYDACLVKVYTDEGITGIGESDTSPEVLRAMINAPESNLYCTGLKRLLLGENPLEIQRLWEKMYWGSTYNGRRGAGIHAISAVDIALWDIASKYYKVPIHTILGGKYRERIRAYGTFVPGESTEETVARAMKLVEQGFTSIKFGGGRLGDDPKWDTETVKAVRRAVGDGIELQIDLATKWRSFGHAASMFNALRDCGLNWIEEPLSGDIPENYSRLSAMGICRVAGGEGLTTRYEFDEFMRRSQVDIIQPDITRCGGISEMRRISELADMRGTRLIPHGFSTGILLAATVQFLAAAPNGDLIEYSQSTSPLFSELVKNLLPFREGYVAVPDCIGLGVELDEDVVKRYRIW